MRYEFRLLPRPIPSSGIGMAYAALPLPDRSGRKVTFESGRNDLRVVPFRLLTNLNHFYPVAEKRQGNKLPPSQSRWTGLGAGAAGIRSTEYGYTKIRTT